MRARVSIGATTCEFGLMVRDAQRCCAPHHEGLTPHPEEAQSAVSKDGRELPGLMVRDARRCRAPHHEGLRLRGGGPYDV